jgi:hypothetical protein
MRNAEPPMINPIVGNRAHVLRRDPGVVAEDVVAHL